MHVLIFWIEVHFDQSTDFFVCCVIFFIFSGVHEFFNSSQKRNTAKHACVLREQDRKCTCFMKCTENVHVSRKRGQKLYMFHKTGQKCVFILIERLNFLFDAWFFFIFQRFMNFSVRKNKRNQHKNCMWFCKTVQKMSCLEK